MKVSEHQYDREIKGQVVYNRSYGSQHELLSSLIEYLSIQMTYIYYQVVWPKCHSSYFFDGGYSYLQQCLSEVCI